MKQACCWLAGGSGSPEAGGAVEAGRRDLGPHSPPPGHLRSRDREEGRRRPVAAAPPGSRGHRGLLEEAREKQWLISFSFRVETNQEYNKRSGEKAR